LHLSRGARHPYVAVGQYPAIQQLKTLMQGQSIPTTTTTLTDAQLALLREIGSCMRAEFERRCRTTTPEVRGLIGDGRLLWGEGVQNTLEKKDVPAKRNFRKAAVLTWMAAERLARTSPEAANVLAAESLAFAGLATYLQGRTAVDLERRKKLMLRAEDLVSTAEVSLKGHTSVAVEYSSDIISVGVANAFNRQTSAARASADSDAMSGQWATVAVERSGRASPSWSITGTLASSSCGSERGVDQPEPSTQSGPRSPVDAWGLKRSSSVSAMALTRTAIPAEDSSRPVQRQPPRARAFTL
jgi:hypothetical protein